MWSDIIKKRKEFCISFETAVLLKKAGYREECKYYWWRAPRLKKLIVDYRCAFDHNDRGPTERGEAFTAPTRYEVHKWIRDKFDKYIHIGFHPCQGESFQFFITKYSCPSEFLSQGNRKWYKTPEEALDAGITEFLTQLLKEQGKM